MLTGTVETLMTLPPDIYFVASSEPLAMILAATTAPINTVVVDGTTIKNDDDFFRLARSLFQFPDYFWHSWDSFSDCFDEFFAAPHATTFMIFTDFSLGDPAAQEFIIELATGMIGPTRRWPNHAMYVLLPMAYSHYPALVDRFVADMTINPERILVKHRFRLQTTEEAAHPDG